MHRDRRSDDQPAIAITSRLQLQTTNTPHSVAIQSNGKNVAMLNVADFCFGIA